MRIISERRRVQGAEAGVVGAQAALRDRGLRLTGPRHAVLEVVRGVESHPTAEEVHRLVRRRLPGASLGTIYRNLRILVDAGLLKELPGPYARFDANTRAHHHFMRSVITVADSTVPHWAKYSRRLSEVVE